VVVAGEPNTSLDLGDLFRCIQEYTWGGTDVSLVGTAPPATKSLIRLYRGTGSCGPLLFCNCGGAWIQTGSSEETLGGFGDVTSVRKPPQLKENRGL